MHQLKIYRSNPEPFIILGGDGLVSIFFCPPLFINTIMRTDHLLKLLYIVQDDMKRRCEQSYYEEHRDSWTKHHSKMQGVINSIENEGLK
tara:strand:+ start:910 stop:1179 length:270 start_codon:yes stop_codon:yes gene_type:complete